MGKIYSNSDEKFLRTTMVYALNGYLYPEYKDEHDPSERLDKETIEYLFTRGMLVKREESGCICPVMFCFDEGAYCSISVPNYERLLYGDESFPICTTFHSCEYTG